MKYPVFSPLSSKIASTEWGIPREQCADIQTVMNQPYRVAAVLVKCTMPENFAYDTAYENVDFSKFDLVLLTSIELESVGDVKKWIQKVGIRNYLLALGGLHFFEKLQDHVIYRPWWSFNIVNCNQPQVIEDIDRPFLFESLLGARRPHRDFAMLSFQQTGLLETNIVNYRDIFMGNTIDAESEQYANFFKLAYNIDLKFPYVTSNLDPEWEVRNTVNLDNTISQHIPWEIYRRTYYSVICETHTDNNSFYMSEKTGKVFFGKRMFVLLGSHRFLQQLQVLGFQTFGHVIDESYDLEPDKFKRFSLAFEQIVCLSKQDPRAIMQKMQPILEHNYHRLLELQQQTRTKMDYLLQEKLK